MAIAALLLLGPGFAHAATTTDKPGAAAAGQGSVPASAAKGGAAAGATLERCRDIRQKMDRLKAKEIKGWANQEPDLAWYSKNCR
jgi:hypothetical protein